jgi:eukaryotic-like serine/threonine-protein kinase
VSDERWLRVKALFQAAVERPVEERDAFLAAATGDDAELLREVESLLTSDASHVSFLDRLPVASASVLADPLAALSASLSHTSLAAGLRVGSYEVVAPLGAGAMGEVYSARDTKLNRIVALKVLPERFALDPDRAARFTREAQLLATLNHPNIAAIYGLEESNPPTGSGQAGVKALVMELVDGPTLADRIVLGPISLEESLAIARQIAEALEAAHEKGIIHRDLKPANIKIALTGMVKVLDFGLAKVWDGAPQSDVSASPTLTATNPGGRTILGTPAYMSPEQARGQSLDRRTDIWSFGCVLYEMLTGRAAFAGDTISDTLAAILEREPDHTLLPAETPAPIRRLLRRCLEKDRKRRLDSASDARLEIEDAIAFPAGETLAPVAMPSRRVTPAAIAALAGFTVIAALVAWIQMRPAPRQTSRFAAPLPEGTTFYGYVSVSPDGRTLAFTDGGAAGNTKGLWIRDFSTLEWRRLPGTESARSPFWSPDSRYIAFAAGNQLKKIAIGGGPPQTLCSVPMRIEGSGAWNRNGVIIFGSWGGGAGGPLWKTSETGGTETAITEVDASNGELYHTWPTFTEDGEHFVYFRSGTPDVEGIYVGSLEATPAEQSRTRILATEFPASYASGYLFFVRANTLLAQRLDPRSLTLTGEAVPVTEALETTWFRTGVFSVSSGGALAYRTRAASGDLQLTWLDRQGKRLSTVGQPDKNAQVSLSPDGSRAAVRDAFYGEVGDLWMLDLANGRRTRLTILRSDYSPAVWSPDSSRIAFAGGNIGDTLYEKPSSGVGDEKVLLKEPGTRHYPTSWSRDGRFLLYHTENTPTTGYDLWVLPLQGDHKPERLLGDAFNEWAGVFSPDTRWIAYASNESGGNVYVRPFLPVGPSGVPAVGKGKWQVSKDVGNWPRWIGSEIFFSDIPTGTSEFTVGVNTNGAVVESGVPQRLFTLPYSADLGGFDVSPDAQRFLWAGPQAERTAQVPITVVLNWQEDLKHRTPTK